MSSDQCDCRNASANIRTLFDIAWSCFSTIFICTWVSVHPNLPPPGEAFVVTCARRLKIMLYTFLLPEFVLFWALQQWFGARIMVGLFGDRGWTKTHGFFLMMGGFHLHKGDEDLGVLSFDLLSELVESNEIVFPTISAEHIQDRSKGDVITKSIALSQTIWFILQCIARGAQGLMLTELELLTLALASLNWAMYAFWWEKPLDVRMYVPVYLRDGVEFMHRPELRRVNLSGEEAIEKAAHHIPTKWAALVPKPFRNVRSSFLTLFSSVLSKCRADWKDKHPLLFLLKWLPLLPLSLFFIPFLELTNEEIRPGSDRVPTFYTHPIREERNDNIASATLLLFGVEFGGIHMIAWGFAFPSRTTQVVWRVSALAVTLIPVSVVSGGIIALFVSEDDPDKKGKKGGWRSALDVVLYAFSLLGVLLLMGYILARVVLLVEGLMLLKDLSPEAYADVEWTRFIPHLR